MIIRATQLEAELECIYPRTASEFQVLLLSSKTQLFLEYKERDDSYKHTCTERDSGLGRKVRIAFKKYWTVPFRD